MLAIVTGTCKAWLLARRWDGVGVGMELGDMRPGIMDQAFFSRRQLLLMPVIWAWIQGWAFLTPEPVPPALYLADPGNRSQNP